MITRGLSCDRVEFGPFWGGSDDPPDPPLATGLQHHIISARETYLGDNMFDQMNDLMLLKNMAE